MKAALVVIDLANFWTQPEMRESRISNPSFDYATVEARR